MQHNKSIKMVFLPVLSCFRYHHLLFGFVKREIKGRFAGSMAGIFWAVISPLATIAVYTFIFSILMRIQITREETGTDSFLLYFLAGFFPWLIFSDGLTRASGSLLDNASLITKVVFPVELLPFSGVLTSVTINGIGLLFFAVILVFHGYLTLSWFFLFPVIIAQVVFTWGLANLLAGLSVFIRDTREFLNVLLLVWFFSTPVIYPLSMVPESIRPVLSLNPMAMAVGAYRQVFLLNEIPIGNLGYLTGLAVCCYLAGSWFFTRAKPAFADVL